MSDSSDEEHPFVKYGTPLPDIDELSVKPSNLKSSVPVFDQIVTDEQGRRRFHGAFTGGFSAGYYNTVGTQEGWVPSSFKSSRSGKSDRKVFTAEDYMDEEDMGEFGIAPKTLATKEEFTSGRKRTAIEEKKIKLHDDKLTLSLGSELMDSLVVPVRSNIGVKLLRSMGWKDGQGIGPHIVRRKKKKKTPKPEKSVKVYGCSLPGYADSASDDENIPVDFQFAPKDQMPITISFKDDHHGIGYSGLDPTAALHKKVKKTTAVKAKMKSGNKLSFYGQAFGVGAYEEDDDDIYAQDSMTNYDMIMGEERNPDDTYGWTKPLAIASGPDLEAIAFGNSAKVNFVPAKQQTKLYPKVYPPPLLPPNYDPFRRLRLQTEKLRIDNMNLSQTVSNTDLPLIPSTNKATHLDSDDRQALLEGSNQDEDKPKTNQSVFDFISWEDRQRLEVAKRQSLEIGFKGPSTINEPDIEPKIDKSAPLCNPTSLKPFANNPEKLRRYEQYERAVRQRKRDPYLTIDSNLTEWEKKHERDEFARISRVYLHLTTNINSRFTKASGYNDELELKEGINESSKLKAFGVLTHTTIEWHPDPLLCKRFNVPNPYPDSDFVGSGEPSGTKYLTKLHLSSSEYDESNSASVKEKDDAKKHSKIVSDTLRPPMFEKARPFIGGRWDKQPDFVGPANRRLDDPGADENNEEAEVKNEETDEQENTDRPSMDLFKSIFASSDEESSVDEEEENDEQNLNDDTKSVNTELPPNDSNAERKSAADVFMKPISIVKDANINSDNESSFNSSQEKSLSKIFENANEVSDDSDDYFGPALPPAKFGTVANKAPSAINHENDVSKSRKTHKHKHKKHDHKSKKKKKKH